jgi:hypothetical protein
MKIFNRLWLTLIVIVSFTFLSARPSLGAVINLKGDESTVFNKSSSLNFNRTAYKVAIGGQVSFKSKRSLLRVILLDNKGNEYLVYETYPLITDKNFFSFSNVCEETCVLDKVVPSSLRVEGYGASYTINSVSFSEVVSSQVRRTGFATERMRLKSEQDKNKIAKLSEGIKRAGLKWTAGETSVSKKFYTEKKKLFSNADGTSALTLPNLAGFEYYKDGIFEFWQDAGFTPVAQPASPFSKPPVSFDWRNVHQENWMTPVKNQ